MPLTLLFATTVLIVLSPLVLEIWLTVCERREEQRLQPAPIRSRVAEPVWNSPQA